ncbi:MULTISPECIES: hypothetical protein [Rhodanobacter]|uniref:hypothetical protein n=1 Tax=Rhodanobacter TaxID=75309 RepID=UPI0012DD61E2|nr:MULTISPECIES: hypothetical protein [Rhodanobacter]UJJ49836.1 hypothetical protein LRK52_11395 [Rhodanobacter denitrificans]UJM92549.1 hypothetical protein LRK32_11305 [Rhodanobacter denitrificans]UJM96079.1 hypothetical protein LRK44_11310 [Rhodanobacter denitrificans]UJN21090.1 hypothetical protein LRK54_15330 [Rhodanobacter denitrificans]
MKNTKGVNFLRPVFGAMLPLLSVNALDDRDKLARGKRIKFSDGEYFKTPLRPFWVAERDTDIAKIFIAYFSAVAAVWPNAWVSREPGDILPRTNGFRALMRFFRLCYLKLRPEWDAGQPLASKEDFAKILRKIDLDDDSFNIENFPPGTSGEKRLFDRLRSGAKL